MFRSRRNAAALGLTAALVLTALTASPASASPYAGRANAAPTLAKPVFADGKVTLTWTDQSSNETSFIVVRRDYNGGGGWQWLAEVITPDVPGAGETLTYVDPAPIQDPFRCYQVWSYDWNASWTGYSDDLCTGEHGDPLASPVDPPFTLTPSATSMSINFTDASDNEDGFIVYKRDTTGTWKNVQYIPTRDSYHRDGFYNGKYSWLDTGTGVSGQCYSVAAVNNSFVNLPTGAREQCKVRTDPMAFPQTIPTVTQQWSGLSAVNDGTGELYNTVHQRDLYNTHRTFGPDLDWQSSPSLWKVEAQGGPKLVKGQLVALRVWGGGWVHFNGFTLVLQSNPAYEWRALGHPNKTGAAIPPDSDGTAYRELNAGDMALYNDVAKDFLVYGTNVTGGPGAASNSNLAWYRETMYTPPPAQPGVKTLTVFNCKGSPSSVDPTRAVSFWVRDVTAGTAYSGGTHVGSNWTTNNCGPSAFSGTPFTFTPSTTGHLYEVQVVDFTLPGCTDNPVSPGGFGCLGGTITVLGDTNGVPATTYAG